MLLRNVKLKKSCPGTRLKNNLSTLFTFEEQLVNSLQLPVHVWRTTCQLSSTPGTRLKNNLSTLFNSRTILLYTCILVGVDVNLICWNSLSEIWRWFLTTHSRLGNHYTWKMSKCGVFLVRIFPHWDWIRRVKDQKTPYLDNFHAVNY